MNAKYYWSVFTSISIVAFTCRFVAHGQAQQAGSTIVTNDVPQYSVAEIGFNHRVWRATNYDVLPNGTTRTHVHQYTELATGMNYRNADGQWVESSEQIATQSGGGAAAVQGLHQVYFPADIFQGTIQTVTPDGRQLNSRPLGVYYYDGVSSVMLGELQDSTGQISASGNRVIYTNVFNGIDADVVCTYHKSGFESDVVFRNALPTPDSLGLNPDTTKLELLTEFYNTEDPQEIPQGGTALDGLSDVTLKFGDMKMIRGKAFSIKGSSHGASHQVYKSWVHYQNRKFLIEEIPYDSVANELLSLPSSGNQGSSLHIPEKKRMKLSPEQLAPAVKMAENSGAKAVLLAASKDYMKDSGFVLDYVQVDSGQTNFTFQGDTTYFITGGDLYLDGTTTIEGNTVLKFDTSIFTDPPVYSTLVLTGPVVCNTNAYRTAVVTTSDDNSVGENFGGSIGSPSVYGAPYLDFQGTNPVSLNYLRFCYGSGALKPETIGSLSLQDCQFVNSQTAIQIHDTSGNLFLRNVLFAMDTVAMDVSNAHPNIICQQVTFDESAGPSAFLYWGSTNGTPTSLSMTNCLLYDGGGTLSAISSALTSGGGTYATAGTCETTSNPFLQVGGGNYYLSNSSPYRASGSTNIDAALMADIRTKTTFAPTQYSDVTFTNPMTFTPCVPRDLGNPPDVGYHYDPLDYTFGGCFANSNVTFTAGTAAGWFRTTSGWYQAGYGLALADQQSGTFTGNATNFCHWERMSLVQEYDTSGGYGEGAFEGWGSSFSNSPQVYARFLKGGSFGGENGYIFIDDGGYLTVHLQDCEFHESGVGGLYIGMYLTNCLLDRCNISQVEGHDGNEVVLMNCTMIGAYLQCNSWMDPVPFLIMDCAFDGTTVQQDGFGADPDYVNYDYNAFSSDITQLSPEGTNTLTISDCFNWQTGPLGSFYQLVTSPLIDKGSTTADQVGLYHYTTQLSETKEAFSIVDIGYHYVALDINGNPDDTNGDQIPDYLEDANGNGLVDNGETSWIINPYNGLSLTNGLTVFTPLK